MPKRKQPSTLKDLCLKNIAENLERHALLYFREISEASLHATSNKTTPMLKESTSSEDFSEKNIARNLETHTLSHLRTKSEVSLYEPFQRHFSNKLLNILLEKKSDKYYHLQVLFDEAYKGDEMCMRCLEFIFNSKLTKVCLPHPNEYEKQRFNLRPELLIKLLYNCQKIAVLDLQRISIEDELFIPLVKHSLKNVVHINIAYTNCGDKTVSAIWRHCPHLKYLKMPKNGITDEGMKMICGNYFNAKTNGSQFFGYCKNPIECSVKPKLKYLNINGNDITKNITTLDLNHFGALDDELLLPVIENSLQNVVHLVLACTYVGDKTLSAIMRYCPLLTHLDLSGTSITDEGLKMLCGNYLNAKQNEVLPCFCPNPTNCSVRPKLKYFDITCREVTNTGLMWILHHFDSLENLEYDIPSFHDGISQALLFLQQQIGTSFYKTNLKKLTFFFLDEEENNPEKVFVLCPKLEILITREPLRNWQFSHVANCEYLTDVTFCIKNISTLESMEFQNFLLLRGHKLTSFELRGPLSIRADSLLDILCHFPKLQKLHFCDLKLLPPTDNYLSNNKHVAHFKDLSMDKLETLIISSTYGYKSAVSGLVAHIISNSHNLKFLEITYSRVSDKAFSPVETCNALYNLRELKLNSCSITKKFLWKFIKGDNQLETLKIEDCDHITLKILRKMQKYVAKKNFIIETYE